MGRKENKEIKFTLIRIKKEYIKSIELMYKQNEKVELSNLNNNKQLIHIFIEDGIKALDEKFKMERKRAANE